MSNKRQIKKTVAFSAVSALLISGIAVNPASADEIEVTNCLDSGAGSLRDAVENAGYEDAIVFEDLECNTITLNTPISISTSLYIVGPGSSELSITNNSNYNNGLFTIDFSGGYVSFGQMTFTSHSIANALEMPLIFSEGESTVALNSMEVTGVKAQSVPAFAIGGVLRVGESSFHGNRIENSGLMAGPSIYVANSSFVGNSIFEGSLIGSERIAVINSAFVDNFPEEPPARFMSLLFASPDFSAYSSIFADEFITDDDQLWSFAEGEFTDQGSNYFAFDETVTNVKSVSNTTVGNGASVLVSADDLALGEFGRVLNPDTNGLSPKHQQLAAGSVAIDSHTLEQFEVANNALATELGVYLIPDYDGAGPRRPIGPKYDSGPIEFVATANSQLERRAKNVFFNPMSSTLTKEARKTLRNMVNNLPEGATVRRINVTGFVQPAGFSWNNESLSDARARNVKRFLKSLGVKGQWKIAARGEDKDSTSKARRVKVVVRYDIAPG